MSDKLLGGSIKAGSTSLSIPITLRKSVDHTGETTLVAAGLTASYWRQGGTRTAIALSDLAAVNSAYSSGGVKEVDATNMKGVYRLDVPDAAIATGVDWVHFYVFSAASFWDLRFDLTTYTPIADAIKAAVIETQGNYTIQQSLSIMLAVLAGVTTTQGSVLKTPNAAATRVSATINASNERTAMTLTPSA